MRSIRDITVFAHALDAIDDEEFALLYDVTKPQSPMVPFWRYQSFDLDKTRRLLRRSLRLPNRKWAQGQAGL